MARLLATASACKFICHNEKLLHITCLNFGTTSYKLAAPKGPVGAGGGNAIGRKRFRRQPKSTDPEYLVTHVSGSNYFNEGEDVKIKDDSQYPDWIWNLSLGKPKKPEELEFGTKEYWEAVKHMNMLKFKRTLSKMPIPNRMTDEGQLSDLEWKKRIRFRALACDDVDAGLNPDDYRQRPDRKLFLRPNMTLEEEDLVPDEFLAKNSEKFIKFSRQHDYFEHVAPKTTFSSRRNTGYFPGPTILKVHPESAVAKIPNLNELIATATVKVPIQPKLESEEAIESQKKK